MVTTTSEKAERLNQRRARMMPVLAILLIAQQGSFVNGDTGRPVDHVRIAAWLVLSGILLFALVSGRFGALFHGRAVQALMEDEVTRANRRQALANAFVAAMLGAITIYFVTLFQPVSGREAVHVVLTIGIAAGLLSFGALERRALRDG
ncbi:hypothetical protein HMF7854_00070 [Sphingomonas ginkgonis]|uniref:DUF2178 domain-containing protein n=1 Tax=Sphingomonas ginkgonis TaxID=2315330 RepID=A0A429V630_9SPHN|nr:hypothetical protein [Sphingomonas ginkgonis]RST29403.1 hypothetical protein HMF7854_00070 [Sphingomonas ginkgonis]